MKQMNNKRFSFFSIIFHKYFTVRNYNINVLRNEYVWFNIYPNVKQIPNNPYIMAKSSFLKGLFVFYRNFRIICSEVFVINKHRLSYI